MGRGGLWGALFAIGAAWALTLPLTRISVSTGYPPLGLIVWHQAMLLALMAVLLRLTGQRMPSLRANAGLFAVVAVAGAILPGYFTFLTARALPAGVRGILIAMVPMFVLPMALALGFERPDGRRALGVAAGAVAVVLIGLPDAGVTAGAGLGMLLLALVSPLGYAVEANYLAWRGSAALHPFQVLAGASVIGLALAVPLAAARGQLFVPQVWGAAEWAVVGSGLLNGMAYSGYVWLIGRAGSVFGSLVAYLVTGFGVVWSMLLLGERYSPMVWAALVVMLIGIALVQPPASGDKRP